MSVTCRDVSLVSVVSVNCGAIYRQTEKRPVQLRWAEPRSKAPEIVHKESGSPQTTGGCNWIGHKRSSISWEPVLSSTVDSLPHVPIQRSTTAYKLVDGCPDQLYLIDWHFPCIDWLIVKSGRSLKSLQCIPISSIMMDGCRLPWSNLKVPSVLVAPGICHPGQVSLHTKHASEMECSRDYLSPGWAEMNINHAFGSTRGEKCEWKTRV
jgi:hypothetical protein